MREFNTFYRNVKEDKEWKQLSRTENAPKQKCLYRATNEAALNSHHNSHKRTQVEELVPRSTPECKDKLRHWQLGTVWKPGDIKLKGLQAPSSTPTLAREDLQKQLYSKPRKESAQIIAKHQRLQKVGSGVVGSSLVEKNRTITLSDAVNLS